jgi:hypothetical protein
MIPDATMSLQVPKDDWLIMVLLWCRFRYRPGLISRSIMHGLTVWCYYQGEVEGIPKLKQE